MSLFCLVCSSDGFEGGVNMPIDLLIWIWGGGHEGLWRDRYMVLLEKSGQWLCVILVIKISQLCFFFSFQFAADHFL